MVFVLNQAKSWEASAYKYFTFMSDVSELQTNQSWFAAEFRNKKSRDDCDFDNFHAHLKTRSSFALFSCVLAQP